MVVVVVERVGAGVGGRVLVLGSGKGREGAGG